MLPSKSGRFKKIKVNFLCKKNIKIIIIIFSYFYFEKIFTEKKRFYSKLCVGARDGCFFNYFYKIILCNVVT